MIYARLRFIYKLGSDNPTLQYECLDAGVCPNWFDVEKYSGHCWADVEMSTVEYQHIGADGLLAWRTAEIVYEGCLQ